MRTVGFNGMFVLGEQV